MKARILIIEDEEDLIKGLKLNLTDEGYEVDWALDGREGLQKALEAPPDLILLDIMLPGMDGLEVCRSLRQKNVGIPILMLTAKGEEVDKVVKRNDLLDKVWGYEKYPTTRTIDNHILKLRKKIEKDPAHPQVILSIYGEGYRFMGS